MVKSVQVVESRGNIFGIVYLTQVCVKYIILNIFFEIVSHLPFEFAILNLDRENHREAR
jgi:hypothetical protein